MPLIGKTNGSGKKGMGIPVMVLTLVSYDSLEKVVLPSGPATLHSGRVESWLGSSKEEKTREKYSA